MDLCCGKGGDLIKWSKQNIRELVGVDIANVSIEQAQNRFQENRYFKFKAKFYAADAFANPLSNIIPLHLKEGPFQVVSCQFALHYSFETEEKARLGMMNVSQALCKGGYFFGTIPNAYRIVKRLRSISELKFGNSIYSIEFEQKTEYPEFGHKYYFELLDAIDVCPEYLINIKVLERIAKEYGLELVYKLDFHELFTQECKTHYELLKRMGVLNSQGTISADEWEVAGLYMAFAFKKI